MIIKTYVVPPIENNNYLVIDEVSNEALLIDCSSENKQLEKDLQELGATLKYVLLTHGHFDHIAGLNSIVGAEVFMHQADSDWLNNVNKYLPMFGMSDIEIPKINHYIIDGDVIKLGNQEFKVIHTPGHTQGGVCYLVGDVLFTGDTLFRESVGRCDLEGGNFNQIVFSIESKLFTLPKETKIYPGHGRVSTIGWEIEHNNYF